MTKKDQNITNNIAEKKQGILQISKIADGKDLKSRLMTFGFYSLAGILGWKFLAKPMYDNFRRKNEENSIINDPNKQQATIMYNAMNPSGISWMRSFDTTNKNALFESARNITSWNAVQSTYKKLYTRNLLEDLQGELNTEEFKTFMAILNLTNVKTTNSGGQVNTTKGYIIVSSTDLRIRSTPDSTISSWSSNSNILGIIKQGNFVGFSTGESKVDNEGVKYIKTSIKFIDTIPESHKEVYDKQKSKTMTFWVGKGAIAQYKYFKEMYDAYPNIKINGKNISALGLRDKIK